MVGPSLRIPLWVPRRSSLSLPSVLRYEVHLLGFPQPVHGLRSLRLLVGTIEQCQKYALEVRNSLRGTALSLGVQPSGGSSIFLDPEGIYPQEVRSLKDLLAGLPTAEKEAQR